MILGERSQTQKATQHVILLMGNVDLQADPQAQRVGSWLSGAVEVEGVRSDC